MYYYYYYTTNWHKPNNLTYNLNKLTHKPNYDCKLIYNPTKPNSQTQL